MPSPLSSLSMGSILATALAGFGLVVARDVDDVDLLRWYPPASTPINNLTAALRPGGGVYGFIFNSSRNPEGVPYGTYNWCNMPHVRRSEYVRAPGGYALRYVEVIQRHHKRTPYASNAFPVEPYRWDCDDQGLYYYGAPLGDDDRHHHHDPARGFWRGFTSPVNPFAGSGWMGSCQFPQITADGLEDSYVHGADLYGVYHELLGFLPARGARDGRRGRVVYRVTQNVITSQVAGMLIGGTWGTHNSVPLLIEAAGVDSLEPQYTCAAGSALFGAIRSSADAAWRAHLEGAADLYRVLDDISGVPPADAGFHASFDHYFDNLSARQCHAKPLPCKIGDPASCVDQALADAVYRLGQWEYSHIYRDAPQSLAASVASYGVWIAELAAHLRAAVAGEEEAPLYFHNVAHDGSVSRVLSILQIDVMVWPGMGSEVIFELYKRAPMDGGSGEGKSSPSGHYIRVLFGGRVIKSSNPSFGVMDMLPVETLLAYFDGLVGRDAGLVMGKCNGTVKT
ncbi:histidine acid phosphatase [Xylaria palmicola]|nr:histidine acid phosphatase [Xylaria palmicola]